MKHGIYYAYWENEWKGNFEKYIIKVAKLGFDILEIAGGVLPSYSNEQLKKIKKCAEENGIELTVGYGPIPEHNIASPISEIRKNSLAFYKNLFQAMEKINARVIGGALYSYWPVDYNKKVDKLGDWERGVESMAELGKIAMDFGIETLGMECLNRFENYILNTALEGVKFVKQVHQLEGRAKNVKVMLDTFHMNIEEQSIGEAIKTAGDLLGHFHTGECNRMVPGSGRMPWREIGEALREIGYDGAVVMEPFVLTGGKVGQDIKVWRNMIETVDEESLDGNARQGLIFQKDMLDYK